MKLLLGRHGLPIRVRRADGQTADAPLTATLGDQGAASRPVAAAPSGALDARHGGARIAAVCHGRAIDADGTRCPGAEMPAATRSTSENRIAAAPPGERSILTWNEVPWLRDTSFDRDTSFESARR